MEKFDYLSRANLEYIEEQFQAFQQQPEKVDPEWRLFFEGIEFAKNLDSAGTEFSEKEVRVYDLIRYYRDYGHIKARLDPLGLQRPESSAFDLNNFGLNENDLGQTFRVGQLVGLHEDKLSNIISHLEKIYCGALTVHVSDCDAPIRNWFHQELEKGSPDFELTDESRQKIFESLSRTESLEKFIHTRYVGTKRFSIEGGDALLPMLEHSVERATSLGVKDFTIGMAHRGRVNVLANFMNKGLDMIFGEFEGITLDSSGYEGDVKYHMGYSADKETQNGPCHISLAFNPSHLEAVNPVVCGMTRAKQRKHDDTKERKKVIPLQIHGDAAFIGQGVASETLQLSKLKGYTVGGSIHVVINNQVGFTTQPSDGRSTRYSSDIAKAISAPVILVNGDDVEACVRAMDMAVRFRQEFGLDVVIDMICYRRYGHNEGDEPAFTQPKMYEVIKKHPTLLTQYQEKLIEEGVLSQENAKAFNKEKMDNLQKILDDVRKNPPEVKPLAFDGLWKGLRHGQPEDFDKTISTKASKKHLKEAAQILTEEPKNFNLHKKIKKLIETRKKMVDEDQLDWAMGELLAYGTLRAEGTPVRITGQDCIRGTFTHRQAAYYDTETGKEHCPLEQLNPNKGEFCIYNSPLSEMAVLGFEYGNASADPTFLTIWEAQFGDFSNGAQIIIDQFITSGEQKWARPNGLILLLPHGYEGQGPEHSSARLERFLQMCAQTNMQVCNFTTPANLFHALRRQVKQEFRKPLIVMSPKSLLRHPKVVSSMSELEKGQFEEVLEDPRVEDPKDVKTLILCSGKLYYDIDRAREESKKELKGLSVTRVEQLYPFPKAQLTPFLNGFPHLKRVIWAQEEPGNMGAWTYILPRLERLLEDLGIKKIEVEYIGREERASPATGSPKVHQKEQQEIIDMVLNSV